MNKRAWAKIAHFFQIILYKASFACCKIASGKSVRARTLRTEVFGLLGEQNWFLITELCMGSFKDIISSVVL